MMPAKNIFYLSYFAENINFGQNIESINQTTKYGTRVVKILRCSKLRNTFQFSITNKIELTKNL